MTEGRRGTLVKVRYGSGWRWYGQAKRKGKDKRWHTHKRALTDQDGAPIMTDPDRIGEDGQRIRTTRNIRKAERALAEWIAELDGTPTGGYQSVRDYILSDIRAREGSIAPSTARKYREFVGVMVPRGLEGVAMRDLSPATVAAWVDGMKADGLAPSTIRTAYGLLSSTCRAAVEKGDMRENPCTRTIGRRYVPRVATPRPNALGTGGIRRANSLLDSTDNDRLRIGARLALACGLRCAECCALRWDDVDLDAHVLMVRASIGRADGGTYDGPTKTAGSVRALPIPDALLSELSAWRVVQLAEWQKVAEGQEGDVPPFGRWYVIGRADGSFMTPHALGNAWSRLAESGAADGPLMGTQGQRCTFHDLRHTFATHAIACGADVRSVAALMGHADATMTLRRYADATAEATERAMLRVASTLADGTSWADAEPPQGSRSRG